MVALAASCAQAGDRASTGDDQPSDAPAGSHVDAPGSHVDAPGSPHDTAPVIDAPPPKPQTLLLSEIMLAPDGDEFIEVVNPTSAAVDLTHYYVSDRNDYYKLPTGTLTTTTTDFIAQFPSAASLASGGVATIAIGSAQAFHNGTGVSPTYSIADGTMVKTLVGTAASLTNTGELVVLFEWDGTSPLVKDVDLMIAGSAALGTANGLAAKGGMTQGSASYAADVDTIPPQALGPGSGLSTKRVLLEAGHELQSGTGNGLTGDDETSEQTNVTWDTSFTGPTPGTVPGALTP